MQSFHDYMIASFEFGIFVRFQKFSECSLLFCIPHIVVLVKFHFRSWFIGITIVTFIFLWILNFPVCELQICRLILYCTSNNFYFIFCPWFYTEITLYAGCPLPLISFSSSDISPKSRKYWWDSCLIQSSSELALIWIHGSFSTRNDSVFLFQLDVSLPPNWFEFAGFNWIHRSPSVVGIAIFCYDVCCRSFSLRNDSDIAIVQLYFQRSFSTRNDFVLVSRLE